LHRESKGKLAQGCIPGLFKVLEAGAGRGPNDAVKSESLW